MVSIAAISNWVRIFDMNGGEKPSSFGINVGSPISDFIVSNSRDFVAVSSEDNVLRIWSLKDNEAPKFELKFDSRINSLNHVRGSNLILAGCASGRIFIINQEEGVFTDHLKMQGNGPCIDISTNGFGHIAAIFKTSNGSYSAAFELSTGRVITGELNNGTLVSEIEFTNNGTHLSLIHI